METIIRTQLNSARATSLNQIKIKILPYSFLFKTVAKISNLLKRILMLQDITAMLVFAPGIEKIRWNIGKMRAYNEFTKAKKNVPAYSDFLKDNNFDVLDIDGITNILNKIPVIDKESYVKKYDINARCVDGIIPSKGVLIDESSGSSGVPMNWVRGEKERKTNKRMMELSVNFLLGKKPRFIINAFALGPWATGINVTMSFTSSSVLKSLGPDIPKIINTLKMFGTDREYLIMGYPPFLKMLVDNNEINWKEYKITFIFGGEAMSEGMREYIIERGIKNVYGSYGASDLELNLAAENDFTINLRKLLIENKALAADILKYEGAAPMIFKFNPADFFMETNSKGELLISICRPGYVSPKIRYNIHDLGHVVRIPELKKVLHKHGLGLEDIGTLDTDLPLLFHYGRADMAVAFFGCKITPSEVEQTIFKIEWLSKITRTFSLKTYEDEALNKKLLIQIELNKDLDSSAFDKALAAQLIIEELKKSNQDFEKSISMVTDDQIPEVKFFNYQTGSFVENDIRIKLKYIN